MWAGQLMKPVIPGVAFVVWIQLRTSKTRLTGRTRRLTAKPHCSLCTKLAAVCEWCTTLCTLRDAVKVISPMKQLTRWLALLIHTARQVV